MNQVQVEVINIVQEVLRVMVISLGALNPQAIGLVSSAIRAAGQDGRASPMASKMLQDLAAGLERIETIQIPKH